MCMLPSYLFVYETYSVTTAECEPHWLAIKVNHASMVYYALVGGAPRHTVYRKALIFHGL